MTTKTLNVKVKNEKIKREYFQFLENGKGFSKSSVGSVEQAIWRYEEFTEGADYAAFNNGTARDFKKWLAAERNGRSLSLASQYHQLRFLKDFFTWLATRPGYKSRIDHSDVQYLTLDKKQRRIAISSRRKEYPSLEFVVSLCNGMEVITEVDRRDRAIIAFAMLSGMRDDAIASLPIGCFDPEKLIADQDPAKGVRSKFAKHIFTTLFRFDESLVGYVLEWYKHLRTIRLFSDTDPLFPRTKIEHKSEEDYCFEGTEVEPVFWKSAQAIRSIFKYHMEKAKLRYYIPHAFRHAAIHEAVKRCRTPEEMRAISQNIGHENVGTTLTTYGKLDDYRVEDIIGKMGSRQWKEGDIDLDLVPKDKLLEALGRRIS